MYADVYSQHPKAFPREAKSLNLLRDWLSPKQLADFNRHGHFDVIGSHTKRRYRINIYDGSSNVYELGKNDIILQRYCIIPMLEGASLPIGDRLLAQKIAFESNEKATLKIAVRYNINPAVTLGLSRLYDRFFRR